MERRNEGGNKRQVMRWFPLNSCPIVNDFEVFRVLKQADKVYGLSIGPFEFFRSEKLDRRQEMTKVPLDSWHESGDVQAAYPELADVG